jgi:glucuronate isomerase
MSVSGKCLTEELEQAGALPGDADWLLSTPLACRLYHEVAHDIPLLDYHNHLSARDLADDRRFENLTELWLDVDPYKHRAMRMLGVPEEQITGQADAYTRFRRWAQMLPSLIGNALHAWSALELMRGFDIDQPLDAGSAEAIWQQANAMLASEACSAASLLEVTGTRVVCTSNRVTEDLSDHARFNAGPRHQGMHVVPSLRADDLLPGEDASTADHWEPLERSAGMPIRTLSDFLDSVHGWLDTFHEAGARIADLALVRVPVAAGLVDSPGSLDQLFVRWRGGQTLDESQTDALRRGLLVELCRGYQRRGWSVLWHIGACRRTSSRLRSLAGPAGGYAAMSPPCDTAGLAALLDHLECADALPRSVLFNLNPSDNAAFATLTGSFARDGEPGYVSWGPAWWFNDHARGITDHLQNTADYSTLAIFPGMVTDSRSLLSMYRHEHFRRVLCGWLGDQAQRGLVPHEFDLLAALLRRMLHDNPARLLGLDPAERQHHL